MNNSKFQFEPIQKTSIVVELTKKLLDYIFSGSIKPGEKLPTERQLQEALGVGRSAIREALKVLTVLGVLEVKQGDGTYLKNSDSGLLVESIEWGMLLGQKKVMDIIEARREIEVVLVKFAAERRSEEEIRELKLILDKMKLATIEDFAELDISFHLKIAEMAKNTALKGVLTSIQSLLRTWIKSVIGSAGKTDFSYEDHLNIYQALLKQDSIAAVKAMENHMEDATSRLIKFIAEKEEE